MAEQTMRAARFHDYGPPDVLVVEDAPRPEPKEGEVLVHVHAAGVNPVDWKLRRGDMRNFRQIPLPAIPGSDVAGVVAALGQGVTDFAVGDGVFGSGSGAYAQFAVVPSVSLAPKPSTLTFEQAASIPIGARTAWSSLFDGAGLVAGQRLLVRGAAGGVGLFAVQLGRWKGAHVVGIASAANADFVRSLGASETIDYAAGPLTQFVQDVDVAFDTVGGPGIEGLLDTIKPGGVIVTIAGRVPEEDAQQRGVRVGSAGRPALGALLRQITDLIDSGAVVPVVGQVFPLAEAAAAQRQSETGHGRGRIVLNIEG